MNTLKTFALWLDVPLEEVNHRKMVQFIDWLLDKNLSPKTINCYLESIRSLYRFLQEEGVEVVSPVKTGDALRLSKPLPRFLKDEELEFFFSKVTKKRDRAMFYLMLRCGLRVEEVAHLKMDTLDLRRGRILVAAGKGAKDRMVYISPDAHRELTDYLSHRASSKEHALFLVEKGTCKGKPLSVRGIQKRMEYYAKKSALKASCHQLRHTMATQLLNADADITVIQDLLGHNRIGTTQRYCRVSNPKVQRDYQRAIEVVMKRTLPEGAVSS
jgi:site-specific recombinase XerD